MTGPLVFDIETHSTKEMYVHPREKFFRIGAVQGLVGDQASISTDDRQLFRKWLDEAPAIIGHNVFAFDLPALGPDNLLKQARAREVIDTWTLATVLDPPPDSYQPREGARRFPTKPEQYKSYYALDNLAYQYGVDGKSHSLKDLAETYGDPAACCTFGTIPTDNVEYNWYLRQDVSATRVVLGELFRRFSPAGMTDYLWREMRVAAVMSQISQNGFRLDQKLTRARIDSNNEIRERNTQQLVQRYNLPLTNAAGKPSKSPTATKDGKQAIFKALADCGVQPTDLPRTKSGQPSLGSEGLIELAKTRPDNQQLQWVVETLAGIQGLRTVYQTAMDNVHSDGFCHPDVFMLQASGRASFQDPGLTVFGKRGGRHTEREIFLPDNDEEVLFSADFSQIDARAVAAHSQDHNYLDQFKPGVDLHVNNAVASFGAAAVHADPKLREFAKQIGHGWNYNMGFDKLAAIPGVGDYRARAFLDAMERQYPRLIQWKAEMVDIAGRTGRLDNGFGRLMKANRQRAFTQGPALMGQGAARDLAMHAVLRMDDEVIRMMKAFIHDELIFSVPIKRAIEIRQHVIDCMTFEWAPPGASRPVQIIADATKFGLNWGSLYA
jgi:DNA polymerase-1